MITNNSRNAKIKNGCMKIKLQRNGMMGNQVIIPRFLILCQRLDISPQKK